MLKFFRLYNLPFSYIKDFSKKYNTFAEEYFEGEVTHTLIAEYRFRHVIEENNFKYDIEDYNENYDWSEEWRKYLKDGNLTDNIEYTFDKNPTSKKILITPGMAFGTGIHTTTQLAAKMLEKSDVSEKYVLDIGTGSGILAITASLLGSKGVTGIDIDAEAIKNAKINVKQNNVQVKLVRGSIKDLTEQQTDIAVANIISSTLIELQDDIRSLSAPTLIFSGIRVSESDKLEEITPYGYSVCESIEDGGWLALLLKKVERVDV